MRPSLIQEALQISQSERIVELERRENSDIGDFEGSVSAQWVRLDENGLGVCEYKGKKYRTIRLGDTSLRAGTSVQLTYADGIYYSDW